MDNFLWYKTTLDFLKDNKIVLVIVTAAVGGAAGYKLPDFFKAKPVEVTVNVPKDIKHDELKAEVRRLRKDVNELKRWH